MWRFGCRRFLLSDQFCFLIALRVILLRLSQICNNRLHRFELLLWKCELQRVCQKNWVSNSLPLPLGEAFYDWNMNTELLIFLYLNKTMNMSNVVLWVSLEHKSFKDVRKKNIFRETWLVIEVKSACDHMHQWRPPVKPLSAEEARVSFSEPTLVSWWNPVFFLERLWNN